METVVATLEEMNKMVNSLQKMKPYRVLFDESIAPHNAYLYLRDFEDKEFIGKVTAKDIFFIIGAPSYRGGTHIIIDVPVISVENKKVGLLAVEEISVRNIQAQPNYEFFFQEVLPTDND